MTVDTQSTVSGECDKYIHSQSSQQKAPKEKKKEP